MQNFTTHPHAIGVEDICRLLITSPKGWYPFARVIAPPPSVSWRTLPKWELLDELT
jgi:hypothetical protein